MEASKMEIRMQTGTVKTVLSDKGYGFIRSKDGDDFFFHLSAVEEAQRINLVRGVTVSFEVNEKRGKPQACKVTVIPSPSKPEPALRALGGKQFIKKNEEELTFEEEFEREWGLRRVT
jgi:cold shock CspA family protein